MSGKKNVLVLQSKLTGNRAQIANSDMCLTILQAKGIDPVVLDASDPENKEQRDKLFKISGLRGNYPQIFMVEKDLTTYLGDFEAIQQMNEDGTLFDLLTPAKKSTEDIGSVPSKQRAVQADTTTRDEVDEENSAQDDDDDDEHDLESDENEENENSLETISVDSKKSEENDDNVDSTKEKKQGWVTSMLEKRRKKEVEESKQDSQDVPNSNNVDNSPSDDGEGVTTAMRDFEAQIERKKAEDARKYTLLIRILVIVVGLMLIGDLVLIVLLVLK